VNSTDLECMQMLQRGPHSAGELARRIGLTTASITGLIDRLERAGFVRRTRDPADRRKVIVELDRRAGTDVAPVFMPVLRAWRDAMADYDERDLRVIADFLQRIQQSLGTEIDKIRGA